MRTAQTIIITGALALLSGCGAHVPEQDHAGVERAQLVQTVTQAVCGPNRAKALSDLLASDLQPDQDQVEPRDYVYEIASDVERAGCAKEGVPAKPSQSAQATATRR